METILKDINAIVGVTGAFVCDDEGQILARLMPNVFDTNLLSPVGRTMAQTIAGLKIARRRKVSDLDLVFDQGRFIVKSVGEGCLCILCVCRINVPLLNLTANVAVKKLEEMLKGPQPAKAQVVPQVAESKPEPTPEPAPERETEPGRRMTLAEVLAANVRRR
jgi:predicted regulator of Ras-like GTPase activity (Roadblock/LC7/MglB family)